MDPESALEIVKSGATVFLLDVPQHTLFGIDTQIYSVGPAFKGMKMIPPGPHFVYCSSSNRDGTTFSPMIGFFIEASASEVIVRKWDQETERLVKLSEEEEEQYSQAVRNWEFDKQLGPYKLNQFGDWKRLSKYISKSIIERFEPVGGEITIACESTIVDQIPKTSMERALAEQLKSTKFSKSADDSKIRSCYYTQIPRVIRNKDIRGQELTSLNLDKTELLESLLAKEYGGAEDVLLGELQFAFITFLMGQSLEGFLQWKNIITLLLGCTEAPFRTRTRLFTKFLAVIYYQLKYGLEEEQKDTNGAANNVASTLLDESWLSADSFLYLLCKDFFSLVLESSVVDGDLLSWTRKVKELLEDSLGWKFQPDNGIYYAEDDEYAPVIEMLDEETRNE